MTPKEWRTRSRERIKRKVREAGRIRLRDLKRATNYNRGGEDSIGLWFDAYEELEKAGLIKGDGGFPSEWIVWTGRVSSPA
jgi:hypothetical protein